MRKELSYFPLPENAGNAGTGFYLDGRKSYLKKLMELLKVTTRENSTTGVSEPPSIDSFCRCSEEL